MSELHLGRLPEAETALALLLGSDPEDADALANLAVLKVIQGKADEAAAARERLQGVDKGHSLLVEIERKREAFEAAAAKYSPKFEP